MPRSHRGFFFLARRAGIVVRGLSCWWDRLAPVLFFVSNPKNSTLRRLLCPHSMLGTASPCVVSPSLMAVSAALPAPPAIPASATTTPVKMRNLLSLQTRHFPKPLPRTLPCLPPAANSLNTHWRGEICPDPIGRPLGFTPPTRPDRTSSPSSGTLANPNTSHSNSASNSGPLLPISNSSPRRPFRPQLPPPDRWQALLESTLTQPPLSIHSKLLTQMLNSLDATLTKTRGGCYG